MSTYLIYLWVQPAQTFSDTVPFTTIDCLLRRTLRQLDGPADTHYLLQPPGGRQLRRRGRSQRRDRSVYRPCGGCLPGRLHCPDGQLRQWPAGHLHIFQVNKFFFGVIFGCPAGSKGVNGAASCGPHPEVLSGFLWKLIWIPVSDGVRGGNKGQQRLVEVTRVSRGLQRSQESAEAGGGQKASAVKAAKSQRTAEAGGSLVQQVQSCSWMPHAETLPCCHAKGRTLGILRASTNYLCSPERFEQNHPTLVTRSQSTDFDLFFGSHNNFPLQEERGLYRLHEDPQHGSHRRLARRRHGGQGRPHHPKRGRYSRQEQQTTTAPIYGYCGGLVRF